MRFDRWDSLLPPPTPNTLPSPPLHPRAGSSLWGCWEAAGCLLWTSTTALLPAHICFRLCSASPSPILLLWPRLLFLHLPTSGPGHPPRLLSHDEHMMQKRLKSERKAGLRDDLLMLFRHGNPCSSAADVRTRSPDWTLKSFLLKQPRLLFLHHRVP